MGRRFGSAYTKLYGYTEYHQPDHWASVMSLTRIIDWLSKLLLLILVSFLWFLRPTTPSPLRRPPPHSSAFLGNPLSSPPSAPWGVESENRTKMPFLPRCEATSFVQLGCWSLAFLPTHKPFSTYLLGGREANPILSFALLALVWEPWR